MKHSLIRLLPQVGEEKGLRGVRPVFRVFFGCDEKGSGVFSRLDDLGRVTHDRVTTVGTGIDSAVLRISTAYDIRGLREKISSYDNATVGSGNVVNELAYGHNDMSMPTREYQEHEGAKDASTLRWGSTLDT